MEFPETLRVALNSVLDSIRLDRSLFDESRFEKRLQACDRLEFEVLDRLAGWRSGPDASDDPTTAEFRERAESLTRQLEACNEVLFRKLREEIRSGLHAGPDFPGLLREHAGLVPDELTGRNEPGYDTLDAFVNGLLSDAPVPVEANAREPEMVFYQKTPVRIVLELVARAGFGPEDVLFDLGSGLGQVPILANLLCGVKAVGIEFDRAYVRYSERCAQDLGITGVTFVGADVRAADLSYGMVFFLYTPFTGTMLEEVLKRLRREAETREIRIFTYGPCTHAFFREPWLRWENAGSPHTHGLGVFRSA